MLNKTPLLHQSSGPRVFLSFLVSLSLSLSLSVSLSLRLILWSAETLHAHCPARASKTLSRRRPVPSPTREGTRCLCERHKPCIRDFFGFLCKPRNISLSLSLSLLLSYCQLQTTRFWSIKGSQQVAPRTGAWYTWQIRTE